MNTGRHVYGGNAAANQTPCTVFSYFAPEDCADFFSLYTLKENQFVSVQQRGEGGCHEATAMERCTLGIRYPRRF